jgi:glutamate-1-semialdehyde aminotransferase
MTFEGEAVSIAAAHATLTEVISKNVVGVLYDIGRRIRAGYERAADIYGIPTSLLGFEPCMHMDFHDCGSVPSRHLLWLMIQELMRNGIFTCGAFILCLSHSGRDERKLQKAFESSFSVLRQAIERNTSEGLLDERTRQSIDLVKSPAVWRRADHEKRAG